MQLKNKIQEELEEYYDILGHKGLGFTEIRYKTDMGFFSSFVDNETDFVGAVQGLTYDPKVTDIFVGVNPRAVKSGYAKDVSYVCNLVVDIDNVSEDTKEHLRGTMTVDSGRGMHLYYPVIPFKVTNVEELTERLRKWKDDRKKEFGIFGKVDNVHDLSRVMRCPGTINYKNMSHCCILNSDKTKHNLDTMLNEYEPMEKTITEFNIDSAIYDNREVLQIVNSKNFKSPSEKVYALTSQFANHGLHKEEILECLKRLNVGTDGKDYSKDIDRIIGKVEPKTNLKSVRTYWDWYKKSLAKREVGWDTGFPTLNRLTGGFRRKEGMVIGAATNTGKTTFCTNVILEMLKKNLTVLMFSTEMTFESIVDKLVAMETGIELYKFRDGSLSKEEKAKIDKIGSEFATYKLFVNETVSPVIEEVNKECEKVRPDVIVFDFIQMAQDGGDGTRADSLTNYVHGLKACAKNSNAFLLFTSQLNEMGMLRDSRAIEHPMEIGARLFAIDDGYGETRRMILKITKNRYGGYGNIPLTLSSKYGIMIEDNN